MKSQLINPPRCYLFSKQLNLSDFGLEKPFTKCAKRLLKNNKTDYKFNKLVKFIENAYNICRNDFSKVF